MYNEIPEGRRLFHALDHAIVAVRDLAAAAERYAALFGRPASWRGEHPEAGTANALFRLDNSYVELLAVAGEGGQGARLAEHLERAGEGLLGLAFGTDDIEGAVADLRDAGLAVADPAEGHGRDAASGAERHWRNAFLTPEASRGPLLFAIEHRSDADALPLRPPAGNPAAALYALDHAVVASPDLDAARALYGDALGLRLALDRRFEARGLRILFFRVGGVTVEVAGALDPAPDPRAGDALRGLAYRVEDAAAARARLLDAGFDATPVRDGFKPGTRVFTVRDGTAGVPTLVIQPAEPSP